MTPLVLRESSFPAKLLRQGQLVCLLRKSWTGEREFIDQKEQIYGTWFCCEIASRPELPTLPLVVETRNYWHWARLRHPDSWTSEGWTIEFADGTIFDIYPPRFESQILMRWFHPDRPL